MKKEFKDRLKMALDMRKMKAADLSEKAQIPKGAISYYLAGKSTPKSDRLFLICKALDVSEAWLLGYDVDIAPSQVQKNNDTIADIVVKMRTDEKFLSVVEALAKDKEFLTVVESMLLLAAKARDTEN